MRENQPGGPMSMKSGMLIACPFDSRDPRMHRIDSQGERTSTA